MRSQSIIVNFIHARGGDHFGRTNQLDEYVLLVTERGTRVTLNSGSSACEAIGPALIVVPPGRSGVVVHNDGAIVRIFTTLDTELVARCSNAAFFAEADPNVAAYVAWPEPTGGPAIRVYELDDTPADPTRFGRIFRCSTIMVNWFSVDPGPRDPAKLSPHHHDDFEQLSLQLQADYVHHIRTPWTVDSAFWRDDEHRQCASPAVATATSRTSDEVGVIVEVGRVQATSRYRRSASRITSLVVVSSAAARASIAAFNSGSTRTGTTSARAEPIVGRPRRRRFSSSMS